MIHREVLEGMRIFLLVGPESERVIPEGRVKSSLEALKNDPNGHYSLSLDPIPIMSTDLDRDKGMVFDYGNQEEKMVIQEFDATKTKEAQKRNEILNHNEKKGPLRMEEETPGEIRFMGNDMVKSNHGSPTDHRISFDEAGSSGSAMKKRKPRRRSHMNVRRIRGAKVTNSGSKAGDKKGVDLSGRGKRKATEEAEDNEGGGHKHKQVDTKKTVLEKQATKCSKPKIVPNEGLSIL